MNNDLNGLMCFLNNSVQVFTHSSLGDLVIGANREVRSEPRLRVAQRRPARNFRSLARAVPCPWRSGADHQGHGGYCDATAHDARHGRYSGADPGAGYERGVGHQAEGREREWEGGARSSHAASDRPL